MPTSAVALLPARRRRAAEHRLGQLVQAELVHLAGQADLRVGIEPQAEEPLGRLAGALEIADQDREPQRQLLTPLHGCVVERLHRIRQCQCIGPVALLLQQLGQVEPQVRLGLGCLGDLGELGDRLVLVVVPPQDRRQRQSRDRSARPASWPRWPAGGNG